MGHAATSRFLGNLALALAAAVFAFEVFLPK